MNPKTDGRRERSAGSRRRIVAATIVLVEEGHPSPTAEQIAVRAGVSLRTVFRHFEEMDRLYQEIAAEVFEWVLPHVEGPPPTGEWRDLIEQMVALRITLFEQIRPYKAAVDVHRHSSDALSEQHRRMTELYHGQMKLWIPEAVQRDGVAFELVTLLLSIETWQRLIEQQGLTPVGAADVMRRGVLDVVAPIMAAARTN